MRFCFFWRTEAVIKYGLLSPSAMLRKYANRKMIEKEERGEDDAGNKAAANLRGS